MLFTSYHVSTYVFFDVQHKNSLLTVIVTALGIRREAKALSYATQTIRPTQINEVRDGNVVNTLQGKIAGDYITQGSGGPGTGSQIVLRGNRSIQNTNNALIVVDGVPINNSPYGQASNDFGSVANSEGASNINPDEDMTVLWGASAAALYGSQAANGVTLITTKRGKSGRVSVDLNSGVSVVDINGDGWLDLYVCQSAAGDVRLRRNLLFISNKNTPDGRPTFTERAATAVLTNLFPAAELAKGQKLTAAELRTLLFRNDVNRDGLPDLIMGENREHNRVRLGKADANRGQLFLNAGRGQFRYVPMPQSGDVRDMATLTVAGKPSLFVGATGQPVRTFILTETATKTP